jgi:hypothetical protein
VAFSRTISSTQSGTGSHRYGIRLHPSHFLLDLHRLGRILSQALQKNNNNNRRVAVLSPKRRELEGVGKGRFFLYHFHTNPGQLEDIPTNRNQCLQ